MWLTIGLGFFRPQAALRKSVDDVMPVTGRLELLLVNNLVCTVQLEHRPPSAAVQCNEMPPDRYICRLHMHVAGSEPKRKQI